MPFCLTKLKHKCRCQRTYLPSLYGWWTGTRMRVLEKICPLLCICACHCWDQGHCKQFWALWLHFVIYGWIIIIFFGGPQMPPPQPLLVPNLVRLVGMVINQAVGAPPPFSRSWQTKKRIKDNANTGICFLTRQNSKIWNLTLSPYCTLFTPFRAFSIFQSTSSELLLSLAEKMCWFAAERLTFEKLLPLPTLAECWHVVQRATQRILSEKGTLKFSDMRW